MADEPKPESQSSPAAGSPAAPLGENAASTSTSASPAPSASSTTPPPSDATASSASSPNPATPPPGDATNDKPAGGVGTGPGTAADQPDPSANVQIEPLSDGTTPTVLKAGQAAKPTLKGKAGITSIYRRADIMTTLLTFAGAVVAAVIVLGGYAYFTRNQNKTPTPTKVTTLDKSELEKLGAFFEGNTAGSSSEVLTISSSSLFKNRVAISSDAKITGGLQVTGGTALGDLTVDKTSTLSITNIRGQLTVSGPANFQSPAILSGGATVNGNLAVSGNGSFGGSLSASTINVSTLSVSGTLNLNGHLNIGGQTPTVAPDQAAGTGATANISGNDAGGTVSVNTGTGTANSSLGGSLIKVTFRNKYPTAPTIIISPNGRGAALLSPYVIKTADWFIVGISLDATPSSSYSFDYWVVQ